MEFRIFLPRLSSEELKLTSLHSIYEAVLLSLTTVSSSNNEAVPEKREDTYLVGGCHFGVKFRAGKKLEIKIRRKKLHHNVEHWKKVKLGKKNLSHYKNEILALIESDSDQQLPEDEQLIAAENFLVVKKSRKTQLFGDISKELCFITTAGSSRLWISFAVEGSLEDIKKFLVGEKEIFSDVNLICEALNLASELAKFDRNLLPVVAGYPTWVRVASDSLLGVDEFDEILGSVESFLTSVNFVSRFVSDGAALPPQPINSLITHDSETIGEPPCCFKFCSS